MHCTFCFVTWLDYLHCISDFSLFMRNLLTTQELWGMEHKDEKPCVSCVKAWTIMVFCFQEWKMRYDAMRWSSIEKKISFRAEEKETAPTGPQSVHGREGDKFNERKDHKSESNAQTFHSCKVIHHIAFTHCIRYMFFYLKQECRVKRKKGFYTR